MQSSQKIGQGYLWSALSEDRDFRPDRWESQPLDVTGHPQRLTAELLSPATGYKAFLLEVTLQTPQGHPYKLSTEARVIPDTKPCHCWQNDTTHARRAIK